MTLTAAIEQIAEDVIASDTLSEEELEALEAELEQGVISRFVMQGLQFPFLYLVQSNQHVIL